MSLCCFYIDAVHFENRYISANAHGKRPGKNDICYDIRQNISGEIVSPRSCRTFSGMLQQVPGRASMRIPGSVQFFLNVFKRAGFHCKKLENQQSP